MLLVAVLAACGAGPWPSGYRAEVCGALNHLVAAEAQLAAITQALDAQDADGLALSATAMQREAEEARDAVARSPAWEPGAAMAVDLEAAALGYRYAGMLFQRGARQGIGPVVDTAVAKAQEGGAALGNAIVEEQSLGELYGWQAC